MVDELSAAEPLKPETPSDDELRLWQALSEGQRDARDQLIEAHLPLARIVAAQVYSGRIDDDLEFGDYLQFATIGLLEAIDRFDPARGVSFRSFANLRVRGAVLDGLERLSEKRQQIATRQRLRQERTSSAKLALKEHPENVFHQLADVAISLALGYLLEAEAEDRPGLLLSTSPEYAGIEFRQLKERMHRLLSNLPHRERMVIKYHYFHGLTFDQIAGELRLTKSRISQLHKKAIDLLRRQMETTAEYDVAW